MNGFLPPLKVSAPKTTVAHPLLLTEAQKKVFFVNAPPDSKSHQLQDGNKDRCPQGIIDNLLQGKDLAENERRWAKFLHNAVFGGASASTATLQELSELLGHISEALKRPDAK